MRRGDVYLVDFEPARGAEANKERPAIVVSNEGTNRTVTRRDWGVLNVVPLTTNTTVIRPFQVLIPADAVGLSQDSKAQTEQVRAVSVGRLGPKVGHIPPLLMNAVDAALRVQLAL
jgi:mRNA interferase MazF